MSAIGVVGAGRWGTTLAELAASDGRSVVLFTEDVALANEINETCANRAHLPQIERLADGIRATAELGDVTRECHLILLAMRIGESRTAIRTLGASVDGSHVIVHAVRGFEPNSLATPSQIVVEETCVRKVGALLGPTLSEELLLGHPSAAVVASRFPEVVEATRAALGGGRLRLYENRDVIGVEISGGAASVIAISVGIALERNLGPATVAVLMTRGVAEMARVCVAGGGEERTAFGLAGLGSLALAREAESVDVRAGRLLARGRSSEEIEAELGPVDGLEAARSLYAMSRKKKVSAPITAAVCALSSEKLTVDDALQELMSRAQQAE